jgi:hypothetical protein
MGSVSILDRAIAGLSLPLPPKRILELGAGDGSLLLRFAGTRDPPWQNVELTLLDRYDLLAAGTRAAFDRLGWEVEVECADVLEWARAGSQSRYDLIVTSLFLHHFGFEDLGPLCAAIAARCSAFVACEPRRGGLAHYASHLVVFLGSNAVTRADAVTSVAAGFADRELGECWPRHDPGWVTNEYAAGLFTHCFTAVHAR